MSIEYKQLVAYVNAAADMAEAVQRDIKSKDKKVSNATVLKLSKFIAASSAVEKMIDFVERQNVKLN